MKKSLSLFLLCTLTFVIYAQEKSVADEFQSYEKDETILIQSAGEKASEKWKDQRFGMFIHWGPISQMGKQLSHSRNSPSHRPGGKPYKVAKIEPEEYDIQYKTFNPVNFNPDQLVKIAQKAGMTYLVITAKHHAGFSMFDSRVTEYDIISAPYGNDILKELEQACRSNDFNFGFYYSPRDWYHPDCDSESNHDRYIHFYKAQMEELLNNYGSIYEIWFDGLGPGDWGNTSAEVMTRIRTLHPDAMVNDRGGAGADFYTPEHTISHFNNKELWETCQTTTGQWGYNPDVGAKSLPQLMEILLYTWGADGNMLLNIGPRGDGSLNPVEVERLEQIAKWWSINGEESIRSSRGGPYFPGPWGVSTRKSDKVYLHIFRWPTEGDLTFPNLNNYTIRSARILNGEKVDFKQNAENFSINVAEKYREKIVTTIELNMSENIMDIEPIYVQIPFTTTATLTSSHGQEDLWKVNDHDATSTWHASLNKGESEIWIEASFDEAVTIGSVVTGRGDEWYPRNKPELQVPDGRGGWNTVYTWKPKWEPVKFLDHPVTSDKIRLRITGTDRYYLAEFELYPPL